MSDVVNQVPESTFWYYMNERYAILLKRKAGAPKPWTDDPILQSYSFTNVFREDDRGTTWLRKNFIKPHWNDDLSNLAFNCCWYRMFNWWQTGALLGYQTEWDTEKIKKILHDTEAAGGKVFTGAHIVHSEYYQPKIDSIVNVCAELFHLCVAGNALVTECLENRSMERVFEQLKEIRHIGGFMAHEMVQDLAHTPLLQGAIDQNTWTNMGPGAKRGLQRLGMPCTNQKQGLASMVELFDRRHQNWRGDKDLELHCIEFALCELSKYCKVLFNEGRPRSTYPGAR